GSFGGVSKTKMKSLATDFFQEYYGVNSTITDEMTIRSVSGVYEAMILGKYPFYFTKDGKFIAPETGLIPTKLEQTDTNTNTNTNTQTSQVPKTDKPAIELFVMSHCPYGTQAEKGLIPVIELLRDKVDFKLRFVYYAMHPSAGEMEEQTRQYCIQKEQSEKLIPYLKCFLKAGDSNSCLTEAKIDQTQMNTCVSNADKEFKITENKNDKSKWLNGNYPLFNIDKELNTLYGVAGSPTLVINGVDAQSARDPASYLKTICGAFSEGKVPEECDEKLATSSYSPGFGYSTTTSTTAAECG
ncbi:MAG TPA: hypothetical protein PLK34_03325, partial [Candidatus Pacearchaeota archaeon]|nr:hypothetical protein [Candidatus Pacearchaeota archaeon]